jgi:GNAT superfamily N-acetyltransferase
MAKDGVAPCGPEDFEEMLAVVNDAAEAYRGHIPADCWNEPYMGRRELEEEIKSGIMFHGWYEGGALLGVMGIQEKGEAALIRHAYVRTGRQGEGIGGRLLASLLPLAKAPRTLVGTWAAAEWAVGFYRGHGFRPVPAEEKDGLLRRLWGVPDRQIETSVVLELPR